MRFIEKISGLKGIVCSIYNTEGVDCYLSMIEEYNGLRVFYINEIQIISSSDKELIEFKDINTQKLKKMHPILFQILNENWELYGDIVEGDTEAWNIFLEKMNKFESL